MRPSKKLAYYILAPAFFDSEDHCIAYWGATRKKCVISERRKQVHTHGSHIVEDSCRGVGARGKQMMESRQSTSSTRCTWMFVCGAAAADNSKSLWRQTLPVRYTNTVKLKQVNRHSARVQEKQTQRCECSL